jgi:hypothetical protein
LLAVVLVLAMSTPSGAATADDVDGDRVQDAADTCPARHGGGMISGCPRMRGALSWTSDSFRNGVRLWLVVQATRGSNVELTCRGSCPSRRVTFTGSGLQQRVPGYQGRFLRTGTELTLRVESPGSVGFHNRAVVRGGNLVTSRGCIEPGSSEPVETCSGGTARAPTADDVDGDSIVDASDLCATVAGQGMITGCPPLVTRTRFSGVLEKGQLRLSELFVASVEGARVAVRCSRSTTCPREISRRGQDGFQRVRGFRRLLVPLGTVIEVRSSAPGSVGSVVRHTATRRGLVASRACTDPGSERLRNECTGFPVDEPPPAPLVPWLDPFPFVGITGRGTSITGLRVADVPRGARITVACRGSGCAYRERRIRGDGVVRVPGFAGVRFASGAQIEVRVTARGRIGLWSRLTIRRRGPARAERCLLPGRSQPSVCPVRP